MGFCFFLRHLPTAPGGLGPCANVGSGKKTQTVHCSATQLEHMGCTPGTMAAGSHSERKHLYITFCLKNSEEPSQFSTTSCGIKKIGILHLNYDIPSMTFKPHLLLLLLLQTEGRKDQNFGQELAVTHLNFSAPSLEKTAEL